MRFKIEIKILFLWIQFLVLVKSKVGNQTDIDNDTGQHQFYFEEDRKQVHRILYKCPVNTLSQDFISIPPKLRAPHSPKLVSSSLLESKDHYHHEDGLNSIYNFTLVDSGWNCTKSNDNASATNSINTIKLLINNNYVNQSYSLNKQYAYTKHFFTPNGFLKSELQYFNPENFCINGMNEDEIIVQICKPKPNFIPLCCPMGLVFQMNLTHPTLKQRGPKCVELNKISDGAEWEPFIFENSDNENGNDKTTHVISGTSRNYQYQSLACSKIIRYPFPISKELAKDEIKRRSIQIRIMDDGQVLIRNSGNENYAPPQNQNYCIDGLFDVGSSDNFFKSSENVILMTCKSTENNSRLYSQIYFGALCFSVVVLFVIVIVYFILWVDQKVNSWTIAMFSVSQFFWFLLLSITHANGLFGPFMPVMKLPCVLVAVGIHFFNIASFSSMTAINFDLWSTIRSMTPVSERSKGKKRFLLYCIFSFTVPTLIVSIALIMEAEYELFDDSVTRPQYGVRKCLIDDSANLYYNIVPSSILYLLNMIFAILVVKTLITIKGATKRVGKDNSTKYFQSEAVLFGKLFIFMGASWLFELISWLHVQDNVTWYWAIGDLYNILQTIGLFWIFVCKKEIIRKLARRCPIVKSFCKETDTWDGKMTVMDRRTRATMKSSVSTSSTMENSEET